MARIGAGHWVGAGVSLAFSAGALPGYRLPIGSLLFLIGVASPSSVLAKDVEADADTMGMASVPGPNPAVDSTTKNHRNGDRDPPLELGCELEAWLLDPPA